MSVIAKLLVRGVTNYGMGRLIELGCVCDNDLMAAYAGSEEDKLFTKYSPWGEMKLHQPADYALTGDYEAGELGVPPAFYVMALHEKEYEGGDFPGAYVWAFGICRSITDFGGDSRRVEFTANNGGTIKGRGFENMNWKMSVDNPAASNQFKPGERYYFAIYPAAGFDRNAAIRAAHAPAVEEQVGG